MITFLDKVGAANLKNYLASLSPEERAAFHQKAAVAAAAARKGKVSVREQKFRRREAARRYRAKRLADRQAAQEAMTHEERMALAARNRERRGETAKRRFLAKFDPKTAEFVRKQIEAGNIAAPSPVSASISDPIK
jgi:hypothetical protein